MSIIFLQKENGDQIYSVCAHKIHCLCWAHIDVEVGEVMGDHELFCM